MTLTILAANPTCQYCTKHGGGLIQLLVRGTTLEHDWLLTICEECRLDAIRDNPHTQVTSAEGTQAQGRHPTT